MNGAEAKRSGGESRRILWDRRFAAGVLIFVLLVFLPLGARLSLRRAVRHVEDGFFTGVEGRGAVADYLEDAENAALGLITVGANYEAAGDATGELRVDRGLLLDALKDGDISEIANANALVVKSFNVLREALQALPLSEEDAMDLDYYATQFDGAQGAIPHSGYDQAVREFDDGVYSRFPASLIGSALGVEPPRYFNEV